MIVDSGAESVTEQHEARPDQDVGARSVLLIGVSRREAKERVARARQERLPRGAV